MLRAYVVSHHGQPESANQVRCMDCLTANGAIQLPRNQDVMPDKVIRPKELRPDTVRLSPVRIYTPKYRTSRMIYTVMEAN